MTVDELIAALDAKHPMWEMWRTADKQWVSRDRHGGECHMAGSLAECLRLLLDWAPLPVVPRQPTLLSPDLFVARKDWAYWSLRYDGREHSHHYKTKKKTRCAAPSRSASDRRNGVRSGRTSTASSWLAVKRASITAGRTDKWRELRLAKTA